MPTLLPTPLGNLMLSATRRGLSAITWEETYQVERDDPSCPPKFLSDAVFQLQEYFAGRLRSFDLPMDVHGTPFQEGIWELLRTIPYGETVEYGALYPGAPSRAVGGAVGANPLLILVPCHRVVGKGGVLRGYAGGVSARQDSWSWRGKLLSRPLQGSILYVARERRLTGYHPEEGFLRVDGRTRKQVEPSGSPPLYG